MARKKGELERSLTHWFTPQTTAETAPKEARNSILVSHMGVIYHLLPSRLHMGRKLEPTGLEVEPYPLTWDLKHLPTSWLLIYRALCFAKTCVLQSSDTFNGASLPLYVFSQRF